MPLSSPHLATRHDPLYHRHHVHLVTQRDITHGSLGQAHGADAIDSVEEGPWAASRGVAGEVVIPGGEHRQRRATVRGRRHG